MKKALIIDDNQDFRATLVDVLGTDFNCTEFDNAEEALITLGSKVFDIIFLDLRLPNQKMSGIEALQEMDSINVDLSKVVIITGDPSLTLKSEVTKLGVKIHLAKGNITLEKIRGAINTIVSG